MIDEKIGQLLDDEDFWEIQKRRSRFNLFEAIGAVHGELRHSNFLAYLLSPSRPHGLGAQPLQLVLRRALEHIAPDERPVSTLELLVGDLDDAVVHRERDSIDLLIEIEALKLVVIVENKIHAKVGDGQLRRYRKIVESRYPDQRKLMIFLTPEGQSPDDAGYQALSYVALAEALEGVLAPALPQDAPQIIVQHYIDMLRNNIVEDAHLRSLAAKLYERHTQALDFIFASKPRTAGLVDIVSKQVRSLADLIIDSEVGSTVRFVPLVWDEQICYRIDQKAWSKTGRGVLFEVKSYPAKPGRVNISLIIGPGDQDYRQAFYKAASTRPDLFVGLVKPMGMKFVTIFSRDLLTAEGAATMSAEAQGNNIRLSWADFQGGALGKLADAVVEIDSMIANPAV